MVHQRLQHMRIDFFGTMVSVTVHSPQEYLKESTRIPKRIEPMWPYKCCNQKTSGIPKTSDSTNRKTIAKKHMKPQWPNCKFLDLFVTNPLRSAQSLNGRCFHHRRPWSSGTEIPIDDQARAKVPKVLKGYSQWMFAIDFCIVHERRNDGYDLPPSVYQMYYKKLLLRFSVISCGNF